MKKAFTLAEIVIVLSVIGVLTAILLPVARNAMPNKKVMKFKKGHETLSRVISELVYSDKYYLAGDLGVKLNGDELDGTHEGDTTYFCNTFSDLIQTKEVKCREYGSTTSMYCINHDLERATQSSSADSHCLAVQKNDSNQTKASKILSKDNISFFEANSKVPFGWKSSGARSFIAIDPNTNTSIAFKALCFDIDEWNKGEAPFGYEVNAYGRIQASARARQWLSKTIQDED